MAVEPGKLAYIHLAKTFDTPRWREVSVIECKSGWVRVVARAKRAGEVADHFSSFQVDGKTFFLAEVKLVQLHAFYEGDCVSLSVEAPVLIKESQKLKDSEGELTYATASEAAGPSDKKAPPVRQRKKEMKEETSSSESSKEDSSELEDVLGRMRKSWLDEDITGEKTAKRNGKRSKFPLLAESKKDKASSSRDLTEEALLKSIQQTSDPLQAMLAMQIADRLEKNRRRRKSSKSSHSSRSDSSRSSRSHSGERHRQRGHAKAIENYRASRRRMQKKPLKYVKHYVREIEEELGVDNGKPYNLHDIGRRVSWGKQKSLQRTHYILSEVLTLLLQKKYERATLQTMLGLRAIHQTALDQGDWSLSWLLTHLPNVWDRKQWGGSAEELGNVAAYLRSMEELNRSAEKARNAHWMASGSMEINDTAVPPRPNKPGKGKEKGKGTNKENKDGDKAET